MRVRFQADADLNEILVRATLRREPSIDFQTAKTAGLAGMSDREVLGVAAGAGRPSVTHDRRTMPGFFSEFISTRRSSGVLIVPQSLSARQFVDDLLLIWVVTDAEEWINRIFSLHLTP